LDKSHRVGDATGSTLGVTADDRPYIQETTDEERQLEIAEIERLAKAIEEHCEARGVIATASIEPERRKRYGAALGEPSLDSICLAKELDALFWTDDRLVGMVAEAEFGLARLWSQSALAAMLRRKSMQPDDLSRITARLLEWNYVSTVWQARDLIVAGQLSDWDTGLQLFGRAIRAIGRAPLPVQQKTGLVVDFLRQLRRSDCIELKHTAVVQAVLNSLDNALAARWMRRHVRTLFGVDIFWADFIWDQLNYWLRLR
jgi:hypothetical protein